MFADHGTGGREGIAIPDQIHCSFIVAFPDQRNVTRNIDMGRAKRAAWNGLYDLLYTLLLFDVASVFIGKLYQTVKNHIRRDHTGGTVRGF